MSQTGFQMPFQMRGIGEERTGVEAENQNARNRLRVGMPGDVAIDFDPRHLAQHRRIRIAQRYVSMMAVRPTPKPSPGKTPSTSTPTSAVAAAQNSPGLT